MRYSNRFSNHPLQQSFVSDRTAAMSEEPGLGASVSSVGDFSRIAGESLSLSRVDPGSSMVMRNHNGSMKDPLSMVSARALS